jgi:superfamily II DNA or RNA helicase
MTSRQRGLYETLITEALEAELARPSALFVGQSPLHPAEAADRIALHVGRVVERALDALGDDERVAVGAELARRLVELAAGTAEAASLVAERPVAPARVLRSVRAVRPDGEPERIAAPLIPLLDTTLLTNAPGEPRVGSQVLAEIASADRIDLVMAFVRRSGIQPLLEALRVHCAAGRALRVLTTTYTGSTEPQAIEALRSLGAEIRVSYDESSTRLHAKAWLFHRSSGFSTAYIGSSNLTHSAQVSGLEWNVRVSAARNAPVVEKVAAVFESYWNGNDFVPYERAALVEHLRARRAEKGAAWLSPVELRPQPFQARMLEEIALSRLRGHHKNLLVAATGTGKTVMAVLDYARLRTVLPRARLLFVAHREEILTQSLRLFRHGLRDASFGELWVGGTRPDRFEHVFASIQSLSATGLEALDRDHFDVVIVDEFHHATAKTYVALLGHLQPRELLGLTATPERADGLPVLEWFDGRIAAELRLWDAIDQQFLAPFVYYGIHDGLDLREIPWRRGRGYDVEGLDKLVTGNDVLARLVIQQLVARVDESSMRALGFCVSVAHARFMARVFTEHGIASVAIWSDTPETERKRALADLAAGRIRVVFSVDLFNEGVDVREVDALLLLRPTDSPTLFLQQLGRGLRKSSSKSSCTVLDFVGHHRKEFRFDRRLGALVRGTRAELAAQVAGGFPFLPAGCHVELDPVATQIVLESIRTAVPSRWDAKVEELARLAASCGDVSLASFLAETGLELEDLYVGERTWSDLCEAASQRSGLAKHAVAEPGPEEPRLRRALARLLHVDDDVRIAGYRRLLASDGVPDPTRLPVRERRLLRMLVASLVDKAVTKGTTLEAGCALLWAHPQVRRELLELLECLEARVTHVPISLADEPHVPLVVHGRYTRIEILAAFGIGDGAKVAPWQTGVYWAEPASADLLAFTLDKTSGGFSPTTRYRDYAISSDLIHWESQSVTRADGETGLRYRHHVSRGSKIMLFARERTDERAFHFLGPATYVKHEGELPMAVTWRLHHALPGDLFASFAAAVA